MYKSRIYCLHYQLQWGLAILAIGWNSERPHTSPSCYRKSIFFCFRLFLVLFPCCGLFPGICLLNSSAQQNAFTYCCVWFDFSAFGCWKCFLEPKTRFQAALIRHMVLQNTQHSVCWTKNLERMLIFGPFLVNMKMGVFALLYHAVWLIQLRFEIGVGRYNWCGNLWRCKLWGGKLINVIRVRDVGFKLIETSAELHFYPWPTTITWNGLQIKFVSSVLNFS